MLSTDPRTIAMRRIDRAIHELRGGYPVLLAEPGAAWLAVSAETLAEPQGEGVRRVFAGADAHLVISGIRARRLGLGDGAAAAYGLPYDAVMADEPLLLKLIDPLRAEATAVTGLAAQPAAAAEAEALALAKLASLLPAMLVARLELASAAEWAVQNHVLTVDVADIAAYKTGLSATLVQVSHAHVPLKLAVDARVLAFRPRYGAVEHLAVCVGEPEQQDAPLVRVHSSCVTGDIFGSLRCDCGEQLQEALARMAKEGHGVLLYMSQEGRGIGIANKLLAYRLQDGGLDTLDANEEMGFAADERQFDAAAEMLRQMGIAQVRLLSNNPDKVAQLAASGIAVQERVSLSLPANAHNRKYLDTKEKRCGHVF